MDSSSGVQGCFLGNICTFKNEVRGLQCFCKVSNIFSSFAHFMIIILQIGHVNKIEYSLELFFAQIKILQPTKSESSKRNERKPITLQMHSQIYPIKIHSMKPIQWICWNCSNINSSASIVSNISSRLKCQQINLMAILKKPQIFANIYIKEHPCVRKLLISLSQVQSNV